MNQAAVEPSNQTSLPRLGMCRIVRSSRTTLIPGVPDQDEACHSAAVFIHVGELTFLRECSIV